MRDGSPHAHQQAAKILKSQGLIDVKKHPEVVELVRTIFPAASPSALRPPSTAKRIEHNAALGKQILKQLRKLRGKAAGPSGWTADALSQLAGDLDVRLGISSLVWAILNDVVPPELRNMLVARNLCLMPKQPIPRPVALGDVFVKLASRIA